MSDAALKPPRVRMPLLKSVRARMLLIALLPILLLLPLLLVSAVNSWIARMDAVLITKVSGELTIAHQHLAGLLNLRRAQIAALGQSAAFDKVRDDPETMARFLDEQRKELDLDFLFFTRADGRTVTPASTGALENPSRWPVIDAALQGRQRVEIDIFHASDLAQLSAEIVERARLPLVPTKAAVPTDRTEETRGMVVHAAAPAAGGALVGGTLLNRNLGFIDEINALVYPERSLTPGSRGTATLFLEDVRISTNVRLFEDVRALGTRVSSVVNSQVLGEGRIWLDRAFVVNDWYVSGYEPVIDSFGERVGMLYVGFLETPFKAAERRTILQVALTFAGVLVLITPLLLRWARGIFAPLEKMNDTIEKVETGDLGARSGAIRQDDEIGRVAAHLDNLLDQLQERDRRLRDWAGELERRVAERTQDLELANRQLEAATKQLIVSEKLAAIGEITAGVAHEINNPLAVIQGNLDVVREDLGDRANALRTEFALIQEQIQAIYVLVSKLLHFARPEEFAEGSGATRPEEVIRDTLPLVQHLLNRSKIEVEMDLQSDTTAAINPTELQQVLVNLMVNAIQAMPDGGVLSIATSSVEHDGVPHLRVTVTDTGVGMTPEVAARVFDPFFTTKRAEGTGLGLSISRKLIVQAGGDIRVTSEPGRFTRFEVILPETVA